MMNLRERNPGYFPHEYSKSRVLEMGCVAAFFMCFLAACDHKPAESDGSQVVAKVNDHEITVHQVDYQLQNVMAQGGKIDAAAAEGARKEIINKLITQQLLVQKAKAEELDRNPNILLAMENARETVLAQAYLEKVASGVQAPTEDQTAKYYNDHPELFGQRKLYQGEQITLGKSVGKDEINERLKKSKSPKEVVEWLKGKIPNMTAAPFSAPAEGLSFEILPALSKMTAGETKAIETSSNIVVIHLIAVKDQPVNLQTAKTAIARYLINKQRTDLIEKEIASLRQAAHIEIKDEKDNKAKPAVAASAPANNGAATTDEPAKKEAMESGISGLK